ncbi:methyl-accepting chemotaxis protein [Brevibacillus humidisoli]|uniref:methyl-accepting chemotaxis protein n=1 Tax=Brevibacillus humidisoli TaxID=2895522 RepID=UPI001E39A1AD|nr:methyl-accepting chemotaxis protein [Brevibacillus humidisoli]UFJ39279.1 methyl-accepting chemotaxis protein [Brevibacillus humidisoli]
MKTINLSVKQKLLHSFLILLLPVLVLGFFSYQTAKDVIQDLLLQNSRQSTAIVDNLITDIIQPKINAANYFSQVIRVTDENDEETEAIHEMFKQYHQHNPDAIPYVGLDSGRYIDSADNSLDVASYDPRTRPWYKLAMEHKGEVVITEPYLSSNGDRMDVTIAKTLANGKGVFAFDLNLSALAARTLEVEIGRGGFSFILDKNGKVIYHPKVKAGTPASSYLSQIMAQNEGTFDYVDQGVTIGETLPQEGAEQNEEGAQTKLQELTQQIQINDGRSKQMVFLTNELTGWKIGGTWVPSENAAELNQIFMITGFVVIASLIISAGIMYYIIRSITRPLAVLVEAADEVSKGDLTRQIILSSKDEFSKLADSFNRMRTSLRDVLQQVKQSSAHIAVSSDDLGQVVQTVSASSGQVFDSVREMVQGTEKQVQGSLETNKTMEEMAIGIGRIAESANTVTETAHQATEEAHKGNTALQDSINQMGLISRSVNDSAQVIKMLEDRSKEINQIIGIITDIASQTNLLALNAAIEAARAGEQGKGFAVVADEVRKLAEQSSTSAHQIADLILEIQQETNRAGELARVGTQEVEKGRIVVTDAGETFARILSASQKVSEEMEDISASAQQLYASSEEVTSSVNEMSHVAKEVAAATEGVTQVSTETKELVEKMSHSFQTLTDMAQNLNELVGRFKI